MGSRVLIISKDQKTGQAISEALATAGLKGFVVSNTAAASEVLAEGNYSLIIFDATDITGYILYQIGRLQNIRPVPLLALYDPERPEDRKALLRAGATAHVCLETDLCECVLQARNLVRTYEAKEQRHPRLVFGSELEMDWRSRTARIEGKPAELNRKEFDMLFYLAEHEGQIISWQEVYREIWEREPEEWNIDTVRDYFKLLRKKLKSFGKKYVQTKWGIGYYFAWEGEWDKE